MTIENAPPMAGSTPHEKDRNVTRNASLVVSGITPKLHSAAGNVPREVTFRDFAALAKRRGWTPEFLAEEFRGKIEGPSEFFHRVLSCKYNGEDRSWVVIPYASVLVLYLQEISPFVEDKSVRLCICGCQRRVYGRKQYASGYCRLKSHRERSQTIKRGSEKANKHKDLSVINSGECVVNPCSDSLGEKSLKLQDEMGKVGISGGS